MKINKLIVLIITATLCVWTSSSNAASEKCERETTISPAATKRYIQCLDTELSKVQRIQNSWIEKRKYELTIHKNETGNTQILPLFIKSIDSKEQYLEHNCQWRYLLKLPDALAATIAYKECVITTIEQFTEQLKKEI